MFFPVEKPSFFNNYYSLELHDTGNPTVFVLFFFSFLQHICCNHVAMINIIIGSPVEPKMNVLFNLSTLSKSCLAYKC